MKRKTKATPVVVDKAFSPLDLEGLIKAAEEKQKAFDALPPEEQAERRRKGLEALAKLKGQPGFSVFTFKK